MAHDKHKVVDDVNMLVVGKTRVVLTEINQLNTHCNLVCGQVKEQHNMVLQL